MRVSTLPVDLQHWLLSPWIKNDGRSKNGKQFVTAKEMLFVTLIFVLHSGFKLLLAAALNPNTAFHKVSALLADNLKAGICLS
jgi:hypothetical protein